MWLRYVSGSSFAVFIRYIVYVYRYTLYDCHISGGERYFVATCALFKAMVTINACSDVLSF